MFIVAAVGWVLDDNLFEQQTCYPELFSSAWLLATWLLFLTPPWNLNF
jgi:hypothetical protein